tara:strand:- start:825 stop:1307 length:483 start_codon:yes stop_codon:yes gene_type:complete
MVKKKQVKRTKKTTSSRHLHQWVCPHENVFLLKPETILLSILLVLVLLFSFATFDQSWIPTIIITLIFVLSFLIINFLFKKVYPVKEHYRMTSSGMTIHRKSGKKSSKIYVPYREINQFKLDKFLHGGRIESKGKRHSLFFNTREEIEKLEKILLKKIKN